MIEVRNLSKSYGPTRSLADVTFDVPEGEVLGLLGPNGAGKTTTMRILTGLTRPDGGQGRIGSFDVVTQGPEVRRILGYLPEEAPLYPEMTVEAYLRFVAGMKLLLARGINTEVGRVLEEVAMADKRRRLVGNLSKGQRQRVGLAQALLGDPKVLILDEPTVGLDPGQITSIRELIARMKGHRTVILSTHILPEVAAVCTRVAILHQGRVVTQGPLSDIGARMAGGRQVRVRVRAGRQKTEEVLRVALNSIAKGLEISELAGTSTALFKHADGNDPRPAIAKSVVAAGVDLLELAETTPTLEDVFLQATSMSASVEADQ